MSLSSKISSAARSTGLKYSSESAAGFDGRTRAMIEVTGLRKWYQVHKRPPGVRAALRSLFHREFETVKAVDDVSFRIGPGERVGFLGPNGAGKTTTLKMLAELLHPTAGEIQVAGHLPQR